MSAAPGSDENFWHAAARGLSRRIHFGWWLDHWLTLLIPLSFVGAITILALRYWQNIPTQLALLGLASALLLSSLAAYLWMRRHREPLNATQIRLEDALGLKARLSAAAVGIGPWPPARSDIPLPVTYRPGRPLIMVASGAALLSASLLIPISRSQPEKPRVIEPPSALQEVQAWLDNVKKNDAANPESIEQVEEKMAELLRRPAQNWYEHASLEAADHLRDVTAADLQQLAQNLADAERATNALAASLLIPLSRSQPDKPRIIEPPSALQEVQAWLDNVKKNDAANPESIEQVEEKMAELLQRPAQNWYEHASLEAADHLRDVTAADLQQLAQNLADAERATNALAASAAGSGLPQAAKDSLHQTLQSASQSMQGTGMQPGGDLMDALKSIDTSQLSSMSSDQLKDLAKQLAQNQQSLQEALKNSPGLDLSNIPEGRPGKEEGGGGPSRGPGTAPVTLASEDTQLDTNKIETLKNPLDLSRLATGDALSVTNGTAKVDPKNYEGPQQGGATATPGDGGAAVWQNTLIPAERETLKRFFK
jgi:hypothetical protein